MTEKWQSQITDFDSISKENSEFVYSVSREYLMNTVENLKSLKNKVFLILAFIFFVMAFTIPVILNENADGYSYQYIWFLTFITVVYSIVAILLIVFALYPKANAVSGNEPVNIMIQEFLLQKNTTIKLLESESYQSRINCNITTTDHIANWIKISLITMIFCTLFGAIITFKFHGWILAICN
jgi:hypothetical protein